MSILLVLNRFKYLPQQFNRNLSLRMHKKFLVSQILCYSAGCFSYLFKSCQQELMLQRRNALFLRCECMKMSTSNSTNEVNITYIGRDGDSHNIKGKVGDNVMYLAQKHDLDIEGACEASLACCTCHVYVENYFDKLNEIEEEEEDMLDLAPFLQENSRLSCQIILSKELDGLVVRIPSATRNFYVDGHKPKPH